MANIETRDGFSDLGTFKSKKCRNMEAFGKKIKVCEFKFTDGKLTLNQSELNKLC